MDENEELNRSKQRAEQAEIKGKVEKGQREKAEKGQREKAENDQRGRDGIRRKR